MRDDDGITVPPWSARSMWRWRGTGRAPTAAADPPNAGLRCHDGFTTIRPQREKGAPMNPQPTGTLPPDVAALATAHQLGAYRETFPPGKRWRIIGTGLGAGLFFLLIGLILASSSDSSATVVFILGLVFFIGAAVVPAVTGPLLIPALRRRTYTVFENGLVHLTGKAPQVYRYDQAVSVYAAITRVRYNGVSTGTNYRYQMTFADGRTLKLGTLSTDMSRLGPLLQTLIANAQIPLYWQVLVTGAPVNFGKFTISLAGIATDRKAMVPWAQIKGVQVFNGHVSVNVAGKWLSLGSTEARKIPNLYTFLTLTEHLRGYVAAQAPAAPVDPAAGTTANRTVIG
jgi:hypothetical protein